MGKNHCELCQPGVLGPWPLCDGLPTWCSKHWAEALHETYGGEDFQRSLREAIEDQEKARAAGIRMWWEIPVPEPVYAKFCFGNFCGA